MRNMGLMPGATVAVQGLGGLGYVMDAIETVII